MRGQVADDHGMQGLGPHLKLDWEGCPRWALHVALPSISKSWASLQVHQGRQVCRSRNPASLTCGERCHIVPVLPGRQSLCACSGHGPWPADKGSFRNLKIYSEGRTVDQMKVTTTETSTTTTQTETTTTETTTLPMIMIDGTVGGGPTLVAHAILGAILFLVLN